MKKIFYIIVAAALMGGCAEDKESGEGDEASGGIYGVITDKATGEPIRSAGVHLNPTGINTVTGTEGQYEFAELKAGDYTINVTKTGYTDLVNYKITVAAGKTAKGDVQIEKLPPSLRVVNDNKQNIDSLVFGNATGDVTRSFNIFNDGPESIQWEITETSAWITGLSRNEGTLSSGNIHAVVVTIDRENLNGGYNSTMMHITSNNGSKDLKVTAIGEYKALPVLNTDSVTHVTSNSAVIHGTITNSGLPAYTERGFVYAETTAPTIATTIAKITSPINEQLAYSANMSSLELGKRYYVRAYAINSVGTAYSSNEILLVPAGTLPTVSTQGVSNKNINTGSATLNGTILTVGDPTYTERGFVYSTVHNPTVDDIKKPASGSGTGTFSANLTDLAEGNIYYIKAYATNVAGTVYGNEVDLDFNGTLPSLTTNETTNKNISNGSVTLNGTILTVGDPTYTERGFVYGTTHNPTVEDDTKKPASGSGTGTFSANVTDLSIGTVYYVRAYAKNVRGTAYGDEISLDFRAVMPTLTTDEVTNKNIGTGSATLNGTMLTVGDPTYTERGFVYSTVHNPTVDDNKKPASGSGTGPFSANLTDLAEGHIYYIKAYATNVAGTVYGNEVDLDFNGTLPTLTTNEATNKNIGNGSATLNGNILTVGDPTYTERGFVYSTVHNPTVDDTKKPASGSGTGAFSVNLTDLAEGNIYYIRSYAKNVRGVAYGNEVDLDFNAVMPMLTTGAATNKNIGNGSATLNGTILTVGDPTYTERGFVYSTVHNPTVDDNKKPASGSGTGAFSINLTDLAEGSIYYIRAYATNSKGTVYGNEVDLDFNAVMPTLTTGAATNKSIGGGSVTLNGTILTVGDPAYTERGFVYGTIHNPNVEDDTKKIASGTGTGPFSANLTDLAEGNIYYIRAYATNNKGTVYGNEESVDFYAVMPIFGASSISNRNIAEESATFNSNIVTIGDPAYTERGFVYSTTINPDTSNGIRIIATGIGVGNFSANVSGITKGYLYYVRAYAKTSKSIVYSNQFSADFTYTMPVVNIGLGTQQGTKIIVNYVISNTGTPKYHTLGICYGTNSNPSRENNLVKAESSISNPTITSAISMSITNSIEIGNTYYFRMYLISEAGIAYSNEVSVTTTEYATLGSIGVQWTDLGTMSYTNAQSMCSASRVGGHSDWRLPTQGELSLIENNKNLIGGFNSSDNSVSSYYSEGAILPTGKNSDAVYWSSTTGNILTNRIVIVIHSSNYSDYTESYNSPQSNSFNVRCVRTLQ